MPFQPGLAEQLKALRIRQSDQDAMYRATYPLYLDFFRSRIAIRDLREDDAKIGVALVYTWMMPSGLKTDGWQGFPEARGALLELFGEDLTLDRLTRIMPFVGGSLIAPSKFLHFFDPQRFAIWDRRVARGAYDYDYWQRLTQPAEYIRYLADIRAFALPGDVVDLARSEIGDCVELRYKELALFHLGIMKDLSRRAAGNSALED